MSDPLPTVLLAGKVHPRVRERVEAEFDAISIDNGDSSLLDMDVRARIRGVAAATAISAEFIDSPGPIWK
jgi:hypothetical protein